MRYLITCLTLLWAQSASATTLAQLSVEELFRQSDFVGIVEVVAGKTLGAGEFSCGALYTGRLLTQFKGPVVNDVEFGHIHGFKIGARYLLFLTSPGKTLQFLSSANVRLEAKKQEFLAQCERQHTGWNVIHSGVAALELTWTREFRYGEGFAVPTRYVQFPDPIDAVNGEFGSKYEFHEMKWIREEDVVEYLRSLSDTDG